MTVQQRYSEWMDLIAHLLATRSDEEFPRDPVATLLKDTFHGAQVSWNWRDDDGSLGFSLLDPVEGFPTPEQAAFWNEHGLDWHPLLRWFAHSGSPEPMTVDRVPRQLMPPECFGVLRELLAPHGFEQQLSIPYRLGSVHFRAFVLAQGGEDFSDEDLWLARRIQPMLTLLERQRAVLRSRTSRLDCAGLTGRELAVLELLADGCTAKAIARRLAVSPRTVHKHLENIYRKLGVRDRLGAVMVATEAWRPAGRDPAIADEATANREVHLDSVWRGGHRLRAGDRGET